MDAQVKYHQFLHVWRTDIGVELIGIVFFFEWLRVDSLIHTEFSWLHINTYITVLSQTNTHKNIVYII